MSVTIALLQKINNLFKAANPGSSHHFISIAPFAFPLSNNDFMFLAPNESKTGDEAREYYLEECEFAVLSNSISKDPFIWQSDSQSLLYNIFRDILMNAEIIDSTFTPEEKIKYENARSVLYNSDGSETEKYVSYKKYKEDVNKVEKEIADIEIKINSTTETDLLNNLNKERESKLVDKDSLLVEFRFKGYKDEVEAARETALKLGKDKVEFIAKWNDFKNNKMGQSEEKTSPNNIKYFETSCIPNDIYDINSKVWRKIEIEESEIKTLNSEASKIPENIKEIFGQDSVELKKISFEICWLEIQRSWFDESLLLSQFWKTSNDYSKVSGGYDSFDGILPSYPVKLVLVRNVEFELAVTSKANEDIKKNLQSGKPVFVGPFMIKSLPVNVNAGCISKLRPSTISNTQLKIMSDNVSAKKIQPVTGVGKITASTGKVVFKKDTGTENFIKPQAQATPSSNKLIQKNLLLSKLTNIKFSKPVNFDSKPVTNTVEPLFQISGLIKDNSGILLKDAEVTVMNVSDSTLQTFVTAENGQFSFKNLRKSKYNLTIRKEGCLTIEQDLDVVKDLNINFLMIKNALPEVNFQLIAVVCKKLPVLPNPIPNATYSS